MSAATRDVVRARLSALERPHLVEPGALTAWAESLPPSGYATVANLLLRVPARRNAGRAPGSEFPRESLGALCGVTRGD